MWVFTNPLSGIIGFASIVLYALVYALNTDDLKMITFVERELHEMDSRFIFIGFHNKTIPVIKFKEDRKIRDEFTPNME